MLSLHGKADPKAVKQCSVFRSPEHALYHHDQHMAIFGGGHDLVLTDGCNGHYNSTVCLGHTYQNYGVSHLFTGGAAHFRVDELEVFAARSPVPVGAEAGSGALPSLATAFEARFAELGPAELERYAPLAEQARALDAHARILLDQAQHLHALRAEVERDEEDLAAEIAFIQRICPSRAGGAEVDSPVSTGEGREMLCFHAGGLQLCVARSTLRGAPDSMLCTHYCSDRWDSPHPRDLDADGSIFLDVNPYCFARIVSRLRFAALTAARDLAMGPSAAAVASLKSLNTSVGYWAATVAANGGGRRDLPADVIAGVAEAEAAAARRLFFATMDPASRASFDRMLGYFQLQSSLLFRCLDTAIDEVLPARLVRAPARFTAADEPHSLAQVLPFREVMTRWIRADMSLWDLLYR